MATRVKSALAGALFTVPALAQAPASDVAYEVICGSFSGESELIVCRDARFSDGTNRITAGNLDYARTQTTASGGKIWHLDSGIRVEFGDAVIEADSGSFEFDREELVVAELRGSPVSMSDYDAAADISFSGSADRILLDNTNTTLSLFGRATLTRRKGERELDNYEGCDWVYNWTEHSFSAGTPDCAVRLILSTSRDDEDTESPTVTP